MPEKAGSNAEARGRTRSALLQAGADLLVESHLRNPFAALRVRGVCERAGYSTGVFYMHWPTFGDYCDHLAKRLAATDTFDADAAVLKEAVERTAGASALAAVAHVADLDLQLLAGNVLYDAMELLNVTWGRSRFQAEMAGGYRVFDADTGELYRAVLARLGREPRPPLDWDKIGVMLQAVLEGCILRHKVDPGSMPLSSNPDLSPYATTVAAVLAVVTRPAGDDRSLTEALGWLLEGPAGPADGRDPAG